MKKLTLILGLLALVLGMSQCTKQKPMEPHYTGSVGDMYIQDITVKASRGGSSNAKVDVQDVNTALLKLTWEKGDQIYVYDNNESNTELCGVLTLAGDDGSAEGEFTGTVTSTEGAVLTFCYYGKGITRADGFDPKDVTVDFSTQDGKLETIKSNLVLVNIVDGDNEPVIFHEGDYEYDVTMGTPYAIVKFEFSGFTANADITISYKDRDSDKDYGCKFRTDVSAGEIGMVWDEDTPPTLTAPEEGKPFYAVLRQVSLSFQNHKFSGLVFSDGTSEGRLGSVGTGWGSLPYWIKSNTYYTKEGSLTGEAILVEAVASKPAPVVTTTGKCELCYYTLGGEVTVTEAQHCKYGMVYAKTSENDDPTMEGYKCGYMEVDEKDVDDEVCFNFDINPEDFEVCVEYTTKAYAIGESGKIVYGEKETFELPAPIPAEWENGMNPHAFTSQGKDVYFSQGNLQYDGEWKFADYQFEYGGNRGFDLLSWATSGLGKNVKPYYSGGNYNYYPDGIVMNSTLSGTSDWGYNAISNGGNKQNYGWFTMTSDQWTKVKDGCEYATIGKCANGIILFPKDWSWSEDMTDIKALFDAGIGEGEYGVKISYDHWRRMELKGAAFLPRAGYFDDNGHTNDGGYYWTSEGVMFDIRAYSFDFFDNKSILTAGCLRRCAHSVRLVKY